MALSLKIDRSERHKFLSRFLQISSLFFFLHFIGGKRKGEKNNQSRGKNPCLSDRSLKSNNCNVIPPNPMHDLYKQLVWRGVSCCQSFVLTGFYKRFKKILSLNILTSNPNQIWYNSIYKHYKYTFWSKILLNKFDWSKASTPAINP